MNRRERLENKIAKREEWAAKAEARGEARLSGARRIMDGIPLGQPILIGHHSERHHRADIKRIDNGVTKGLELLNLSKHHESKAAGLADQLDRCVFSDDDNAIEALTARMEEKITKRDRMKQVNALYRKGDAQGLAALGLDLERLKAKLAELGPYFGKAPHMPYEFTNLGASIKTDERRIADVKRRTERAEKAEAAPGGILIEKSSDGEYSSVTFAEKPDREILNALKAAGFWWSGGRWNGKTSALPSVVSEMVSRVA